MPFPTREDPRRRNSFVPHLQELEDRSLMSFSGTPIASSGPVLAAPSALSRLVEPPSVLVVWDLPRNASAAAAPHTMGKAASLQGKEVAVLLGDSIPVLSAAAWAHHLNQNGQLLLPGAESHTIQRLWMESQRVWKHEEVRASLGELPHRDHLVQAERIAKATSPPGESEKPPRIVAPNKSSGANPRRGREEVNLIGDEKAPAGPNHSPAPSPVPSLLAGEEEANPEEAVDVLFSRAADLITSITPFGPLGVRQALQGLIARLNASCWKPDPWRWWENGRLTGLLAAAAVAAWEGARRLGRKPSPPSMPWTGWMDLPHLEAKDLP